MTNDTFMTLAQISATFLSVTFVGFSFFLENLRHAGDEVRRLAPSASEATSSVVYVMVGYSLSIYGVALIISLAGLAANQHFTYATQGFSALIFMMWLSMEALLRRQSVTYQIRKLRHARPVIWRWIQIRVWFVRVFFPITALSLYKFGLCCEEVLFEVLFYETIVSIVMGTTFSIMDLGIFRAKNILFFWDSVDDFFGKIDEDIKLKMKEAERRYNKFKDVMEKYSLSNTPIIGTFWQSINEQYGLIKNSDFVKSPLSHNGKEVVSAEEIVGYFTGYQMLLGGIDNLLARLEDALKEIKTYGEKSNDAER